MNAIQQSFNNRPKNWDTIPALMGLLVSIDAIIQVSRIGSMDFSNAGRGMEMDAIAAVLLQKKEKTS
ncbi:hypothetical protein [Cytobacillus dafuensis]|uniref:hypothetical protein n=1 Tax=Cytobacillus dafuensis TaxID=1742359 RepID=UPI00070DD12D|nr:hypothetical protein [Cytobacillus dafuensis]